MRMNIMGKKKIVHKSKYVCVDPATPFATVAESRWNCSQDSAAYQGSYCRRDMFVCRRVSCPDREWWPRQWPRWFADSALAVGSVAVVFWVAWDACHCDDGYLFVGRPRNRMCNRIRDASGIDVVWAHANRCWASCLFQSPDFWRCAYRRHAMFAPDDSRDSLVCAVCIRIIYGMAETNKIPN